MTPEVRAAAHAALDLALDAIEREEAARQAPKAKRMRTVARPVVAPGTSSPEAMAKVAAALEKAGFR